ncbi:isochorismatase family protein [Marinoscillum sp.]|uniref:isochorismatase family protein n=1 Tax=Marinoscillum sp. TaxID=2024838 RepID=UPI003BAB90D2
MKTALVLIDIQQGLDELAFYGGQRNNPVAENNCALLLSHFRKHDLPRIFIQHDSTNPASPLHPDKPGHAIKEEVKPNTDETVYHKNVNSAFIGTKLEDWLHAHSIEQVIAIGLTTEHCISTSVRMSANLGFKTILIEDATAAFQKFLPDGQVIDAELVHQVELANLRDEFAEILTTDQLLKRLNG